MPLFAWAMIRDHLQFVCGAISKWLMGDFSVEIVELLAI